MLIASLNKTFPSFDDTTDGSCKKRESSISRKARPRPLKDKTKSRKGNTNPHKKRRVSKHDLEIAAIAQKNCNANSRTEPEGPKALALEPNSGSLSQSGKKLLVTYISGIPQALTFVKSAFRESSLPQAESDIQGSPPPKGSPPPDGSLPPKQFPI